LQRLYLQEAKHAKNIFFLVIESLVEILIIFNDLYLYLMIFLLFTFICSNHCCHLHFVMLVFWCQFHQHFMSRFYARADPRSTKNTVNPSFFALLGFLCIKDARKMLVKSTPGFVRYMTEEWEDRGRKD
jgi:hypothetical protein